MQKQYMVQVLSIHLVDRMHVKYGEDCVDFSLFSKCLLVVIVYSLYDIFVKI